MEEVLYFHSKLEYPVDALFHLICTDDSTLFEVARFFNLPIIQ